MKTTKSRIIFFVIALTYNLLLGLYLKDFLVLSQTLTAFYLLSVLPTFFLLTEARSGAMKAIVYIVLVLDIFMNIIYYIFCRRLLAVMTMVFLVVELMCFVTFANRPHKESLLTKICTDCETDEEKVKAIYQWIIYNFEYDYDYCAFIQYFNVRRTLRTRKGVCYDFSNLFAVLCRSQNIPCFVVDGTPYDRSIDNHTWNRVYYDGSWWDVDVTNDIGAIKEECIFYGFKKLEHASTPDPDRHYRITKIY